ncbi:hypothetical protein C8J56DRAFT_1083861 [Mycena floridula]|nr:hypothetical protein C8J56DRAFT_1083861 [Mycena floridula]
MQKTEGENDSTLVKKASNLELDNATIVAAIAADEVDDFDNELDDSDDEQPESISDDELEEANIYNLIKPTGVHLAFNDAEDAEAEGEEEENTDSHDHGQESRSEIVDELDENGVHVVRRVGFIIDRGVKRGSFGGTVWGAEIFIEKPRPLGVPSMLLAVIKMSESSRGEQALRREAMIYDLLAKADLDVAPHYYELFKDSHSATELILLLHEAGDGLDNFDDLSPEEANNVYGKVHELHRLGICHGNLIPQHFVKDPETDVICIVDFTCAMLKTQLFGRSKV